MPQCAVSGTKRIGYVVMQVLFQEMIPENYSRKEREY